MEEGGRGTDMKKRMVAAFLVGVLILSPGCYPWASGTDRHRIAASPRMVESCRATEARRIAESGRIPRTHAERTRSCASGGLALMGVGGALLLAYGLLYGLHEMGAPEEAKEEFEAGTKGWRRCSLGLMAVGGLLVLFSPVLAGRDSKRTELSVAPNGCRLTYRF